jgi:hypothetical protein
MRRRRVRKADIPGTVVVANAVAELGEEATTSSMAGHSMAMPRCTMGASLMTDRIVLCTTSSNGRPINKGFCF